MDSISTPFLDHQRLRRVLARHREARGLAQSEVAASLFWSTSKLQRVEAGDTHPSPTDVRVLLEHYGVDNQAVADLMTTARRARVRAWWDRCDPLLPVSNRVFLGAEASACHLRVFGLTLIPDLLQIPEYQATLAPHWLDNGLPGSAACRVQAPDILAQRQAIVRQPTGRRLEFVIDESCLQRNIGGAEVTRRQLQELLRLTACPDVSIRMVPLDAGAHPGLRGSFSVFEFPCEEIPDMAFETTAETAPLQRHMPNGAQRLRREFERITTCALPERDTVTYLQNHPAAMDSATTTSAGTAPS